MAVKAAREEEVEMMGTKAFGEAKVLSAVLGGTAICSGWSESLPVTVLVKVVEVVVVIVFALSRGGGSGGGRELLGDLFLVFSCALSFLACLLPL